MDRSNLLLRQFRLWAIQTKTLHIILEEITNQSYIIFYLSYQLRGYVSHSLWEIDLVKL